MSTLTTETESVRDRLEAREEAWLAPAATRSLQAARPRQEPESAVRTAFQRDRDRILHSTSFRRLMHKTQVFIAPTGDHFRTRLTHTLEVTQIARTIGRALRLNEDLIEAIALGHDLGHTPFGHAGERALAEVYPGFRHHEQSVRVIDVLEKDGRGLNLTDVVRDGILHHSKARSGLTDNLTGRSRAIEGEVVKLADGIAYINHDLDDAIRAGLIALADVPAGVVQNLGDSHAGRIDTLVRDVITQSAVDSVPGTMSISPAVRAAANTLRDFLFDRIYTPLNAEPNTLRAQHIVRALFTHFAERPDELAAAERPPNRHESAERQAADFVASMTDRYAIELYERLFVPHDWPL